jgi:mRNA interferase MazF
MANPSRGEVWLADLDPTRGHEQSGRRPVLIVSFDLFNHGPADLVVVAPLAKTDRGIPLHVAVDPPEGGLKVRSVIMTDMIRSISKDRLIQAWAQVTAATMSAVDDRLRILLAL